VDGGFAVEVEVARMEGLQGHQSIWKAQFVPRVSST
jgi:hypothetical protein